MIRSRPVVSSDAIGSPWRINRAIDQAVRSLIQTEDHDTLGSSPPRAANSLPRTFRWVRATISKRNDDLASACFNFAFSFLRPAAVVSAQSPGWWRLTMSMYEPSRRWSCTASCARRQRRSSNEDHQRIAKLRLPKLLAHIARPQLHVQLPPPDAAQTRHLACTPVISAVSSLMHGTSRGDGERAHLGGGWRTGHRDPSPGHESAEGTNRHRGRSY